MRWDRAEEAYPVLVVGTKLQARVEAAAAVLVEVMTLSDPAGPPFDALVVDAWPDTNRLIAHLQMDNVAIGYDTGFRVTLRTPIAHLDSQDAMELAAALFEEAAPLARERLGTAGELRIWVTAYGEGAVQDGEDAGRL